VALALVEAIEIAKETFRDLRGWKGSKTRQRKAEKGRETRLRNFDLPANREWSSVLTTCKLQVTPEAEVPCTQVVRLLKKSGQVAWYRKGKVTLKAVPGTPLGIFCSTGHVSEPPGGMRSSHMPQAPPPTPPNPGPWYLVSVSLVRKPPRFSQKHLRGYPSQSDPRTKARETFRYLHRIPYSENAGLGTT
jgi:hypothetical protein